VSRKKDLGNIIDCNLTTDLSNAHVIRDIIGAATWGMSVQRAMK